MLLYFLMIKALELFPFLKQKEGQNDILYSCKKNCQHGGGGCQKPEKIQTSFMEVPMKQNGNGSSKLKATL